MSSGMPKTYLIGVDLGTSATKAALYTPDGVLVFEASREVPVYTLRPGVVEQENADFYPSAAASVRECLQKSGVDPRQVAGIAYDSQMAGIGSIDEQFKPAARFDSWLDMRCQPYVEWMERTAGDSNASTAARSQPRPKMLWWRHEPAEYARIAASSPRRDVAGRWWFAPSRPSRIYVHPFYRRQTSGFAWSRNWRSHRDRPDRMPRSCSPGM
jgi:xylulokinase